MNTHGASIVATANRTRFDTPRTCTPPFLVLISAAPRGGKLGLRLYHPLSLAAIDRIPIGQKVHLFPSFAPLMTSGHYRGRKVTDKMRIGYAPQRRTMVNMMPETPPD